MELTPLEKWERLTFADNFIFCKVLEDNPDVCKELLELLLDIKIERIEQPVSERYFKTDFDSRGIRFDVYVKDENGRSFDIEIQTSHNTNFAKRARYYQGLIDVDNLQSGEDYNKFFQIVKGFSRFPLSRALESERFGERKPTLRK